jgi:hypothetical protein
MFHCSKLLKNPRSYALDAERRMGEMLKETERAVRPPGPGRGKVGDKALPTFSETSTLSDLGISKRESAEAQKLAAFRR